MAPNRKNTAALVETLSNGDLLGLSETIQSKYLPLTHTDEINKTNTTSIDIAANRSSASVSYWDWPADVVNESFSLDLFSAAHIEANLKKAAAKTRQKVEEDYATETNSKDAPNGKLGTAFWDWPAEEDLKKATIDLILNEECARERVSGDCIERTLRIAACPLKVSQCLNPSSDYYWNWISCDNEKGWDSSKGTQWLLDYEAARELLSGQRIEEQLLRWSEKEETSLINNKCADADYWTWPQASPIC